MTWRMRGVGKKIYLTFDDGPNPEVTPWVLDTLSAYNAKATFFCIGTNVMKHPQLYQEIIKQGHQTGNHTQHHLNGWKVKNKEYFEDIEECRKLVNSCLYRPPYGKIRPSQIRYLKNNYKLVMWDVISQDYDAAQTADQCYQRVIREYREGSIIVFHDSLKAEKRLRGSLPLIMDHLREREFEFLRIEEQ